MCSAFQRLCHITSLGIPSSPQLIKFLVHLKMHQPLILFAVPHTNLQNYCPHSNCHILKLHLTTRELGLTVILITCLLSTFPLSGIIGAHKGVNRNTVHWTVKESSSNTNSSYLLQLLFAIRVRRYSRRHVNSECDGQSLFCPLSLPHFCWSHQRAVRVIQVFKTPFPKTMWTLVFRFPGFHPEHEHCLHTYNCTSSDSETSETWKKENCVPESIRNNKVLFIANLVVVFTIGLLGNILILLALPYVWFSYKKSFPGVWDFQ